MGTLEIFLTINILPTLAEGHGDVSFIIPFYVYLIKLLGASTQYPTWALYPTLVSSAVPTPALFLQINVDPHLGYSLDK